MLREGNLGRPGKKCEGYNELDLPKILELWSVLMGIREQVKTPLDFKNAGHYFTILLEDKWDK